MPRTPVKRSLVFGILVLLFAAAPAAANRARIRVWIPPGAFDPRAPAFAESVAAGPNGTIWFVDNERETVGRIARSGRISEFKVPTKTYPHRITRGPDGNMYFTGEGEIGRVTPNGMLGAHELPENAGNPRKIITGPDHALWFTQGEPAEIGRLTPSAALTEFPFSRPQARPSDITVGPDGALWFTFTVEPNRTGPLTGPGGIGRISTSGVLTEPLPDISGDPTGITGGPDHAVWFADNLSGTIYRLGLAGDLRRFHLGGKPTDMASGPDGALWISDSPVGEISRLTTSGSVTRYRLRSGIVPTSISRGPGRSMIFAALGRTASAPSSLVGMISLGKSS